MENDEKRNEDYKKLKKLMDEYYRAYIDEALSNVHLSDLDRYAELYSIQNKSDKEVAEFKKIQQQMRKQIVKFLKDGKDHQYIFKGKLIKEILPEFFNDESGSRKEDLDLIKSFKDFTVMCGGFWENRKNMFSAEEKSTAIAYRVVHENLPKFMNNIRIFRLFIDEKVDCSEKLLEKAGVNALSEVFELDYFNNTLSQRGIELYNCILGGFTEDEKHKVQGVNELINLHNQQTKEKKIPQLQPLYKQILSDTKSLSFLSDAFENDGEVLATVKALYDEFHEEILSERGLISTTLQNIEKYDSKGIFVKNDLTITGLSNSLFVTGKPPVPLQTEANENEEPLARIPRSLFSVFQPGQHRCWQGYFISAIRFLHSSGSFSDHGSRSSRKSRFVSSMCFGISVSRCEM